MTLNVTQVTQIFPVRDLIRSTISEIFFRQKKNISNLHERSYAITNSSRDIFT